MLCAFAFRATSAASSVSLTVVVVLGGATFLRRLDGYVCSFVGEVCVLESHSRQAKGVRAQTGGVRLSGAVVA